jgi:hypothetical protein
MTDFDNDEYDRDELAAEDRAARRYRASLSAHPDCNDPDHPGCVHCEPEDDDSQPEED